MQEIEIRFDNVIRETILECRRLGYIPTYFSQMFGEPGGVRTAQQLIMSSQPSDGFTTLWEMKRLDLTVEALVLRPEFVALFSDDMRNQASERLAEHGFRPEGSPRPFGSTGEDRHE